MGMNELWTDIGYYSLFKHDEQLCGDHVDIVPGQDGSRIAVLADGLGSGVKAGILSTLTARIISRMMAEGLSIDECVKTMAATLPAASDGVAYSTFTMLRIIDNERAEIVEYDNPRTVYIHDGALTDYPRREQNIDGKRIFSSDITLSRGDVLVAMSDGVIGASSDNTMNRNWQWKDVAGYIEAIYHPDFTAKDICTLLLDACNDLYANSPGDDTTACVIRICEREQVNLVFGPPADKADDARMMGLFFTRAGKHIVCGGTTAKVAARYLNKLIVPDNDMPDPDIPPISRIEGADIVTEGMVTLTRVLEYACDYANDNANYFKWGSRKDGASLVARELFEKATDINIFAGRAVNEGQQSEGAVNFAKKMLLVEKLSEKLAEMGKNVKVSWF